MTKISDRTAEVLLDMRACEGSRVAVSEGAVALATMVAEDDPALDKLAIAVGGYRSIERMIAGTVSPCQSWCEMLGQLTDGRITSRMFGKKWQGTLPERAEPQGGPEGDPPHPSAPGAAMPAIRGRLGEVPSGPLFTHMMDPRTPGSFIVTGLGLALHVDEVTGFALRSALAAGLLDLKGMQAATATARAAA